MKKLLLLLLLSLGLTSISYAENIYCSYAKDDGSIKIMHFKKANSAMFIEDSGLPWDISYESEIALVLQKFGNSSGGFLSFYINKKSNKFRGIIY